MLSCCHWRYYLALDPVPEMTHRKQRLTSDQMQVRRRSSSFVQRYQRRKLALVIQGWANTAWRARDGSSRVKRMMSRIRQAQMRRGIRTWAYSTKQVRVFKYVFYTRTILSASNCLCTIMHCCRRLTEKSWDMCRLSCAHGNVQHLSRVHVLCASWYPG